KEIKQLCESKEAKVISKIIDVKNKKEMAEWITEIGNKYGLDLVIANAGISAGTASGIESEKQITEIFDINVNGVLNTVNPTITLMRNKLKEQNKEQIREQNNK